MQHQRSCDSSQIPDRMYSASPSPLSGAYAALAVQEEPPSTLRSVPAELSQQRSDPATTFVFWNTPQPELDERKQRENQLKTIMLSYNIMPGHIPCSSPASSPEREPTKASQRHKSSANSSNILVRACSRVSSWMGDWKLDGDVENQIQSGVPSTSSDPVGVAAEEDLADGRGDRISSDNHEERGRTTASSPLDGSHNERPQPLLPLQATVSQGAIKTSVCGQEQGHVQPVSPSGSTQGFSESAVPLSSSALKQKYAVLPPSMVPEGGPDAAIAACIAEQERLVEESRLAEQADQQGADRLKDTAHIRFVELPKPIRRSRCCRGLFGLIFCGTREETCTESKQSGLEESRAARGQAQDEGILSNGAPAVMM